jgi:thiamine phosphate synthase YjbQ (UPF0047 family)
MKRLRKYVHEQIDKDPAFAAHLEQARTEARVAVAVSQLREQLGISQRDLTRRNSRSTKASK